MRKNVTESYCELAGRRKCENEELYMQIQPKKTPLQKVIQKKLNLFGHTGICRMKNDSKIKTLVFGLMERKNKRGRDVHIEWADDIVHWCGKSLQELCMLHMIVHSRRQLLSKHRTPTGIKPMVVKERR